MYTQEPTMSGPALLGRTHFMMGSMWTYLKAENRQNVLDGNIIGCSSASFMDRRFNSCFLFHAVQTFFYPPVDSDSQLHRHHVYPPGDSESQLLMSCLHTCGLGLTTAQTLCLPSGLGLTSAQASWTIRFNQGNAPVVNVPSFFHSQNKWSIPGVNCAMVRPWTHPNKSLYFSWLTELMALLPG